MSSLVGEKLVQVVALPAQNEAVRPILILTIANGAAHTQAADAIKNAWCNVNSKIPVKVVEVSEFMSRKARFTHITAYLWLVKNAPRVWEKIDAYQKQQTNTSPEWFYRRECRKLFDLAREIQPCAIIATEVGCGEIGALIKRDLRLNIPLIAVSLDYDADRAWIQPEVDLYCLATFLVKDDFIEFGANSEKIKIWGVPMHSEFKRLSDPERTIERQNISQWLNLDPDKSIVLVSGGGEGLGNLEAIVKKLSHLETQIVVLVGHNTKLQRNLAKITDKNDKLRVLGWTDKVPGLMQAADVLVSKLGLTFYESMTCGLPIVALEPPPGAERIQYNLLENYGVGRAVHSLEDMAEAVGQLLSNKELLVQMREKTAHLGQTQAANKLVKWLGEKI